MDSYSLLLNKIKTLDPENATRILGFLLVNGVSEKDLTRLVLGPDTLLLSVIFKAKSQLGISSNTSCAPISRPNLANNGVDPFPRIAPNGDFPRNPSPPSEASPWFSSSSPNGAVSRTNSGDLIIDENQFSDYFPFLNESSKHDDELVDCSNTHLHRRSFSASDACFGSEDGGFVCGGNGGNGGFRPCVYYARGFCKNGSNCNFVHGGGFPENGAGPVVGSPKFDDVMRLSALEQQRLAAIGPRAMSPYNKYMNLLLQQQNDSQRSAAAAALMMQEELHRFGRLRAERNNEFMMMGLADKLNSASRQIYLTFPADSNFKDDDVSEYFGNFGPVQDVRIPYQQKRMFGFVTFVFPETVKLILARGNPHFICDSRVLVKPYKEKGKVPDRRQQLHHQQLERGDFSGCLSPSEMDDLHLGESGFYSAQEIMLRRKLEEADLQQAIELQGRRLINLHLPEFKDDQFRHHQRSFSVGAPASLHAEGNEDPLAAVSASQLQVNQEKGMALVHNNGSNRIKENSNPFENSDHNSNESSNPFENNDQHSESSAELSLSDSGFGRPPTKSTALSEVEESNTSNTISTNTTSENNLSLPTSLDSDMAHC